MWFRVSHETIEDTIKDVEFGYGLSSSRYCPIARTINKEMPNDRYFVRVGSGAIGLFHVGVVAQRIKLIDLNWKLVALRQWISDWDSKKITLANFKPFVFELDIEQLDELEG